MHQSHKSLAKCINTVQAGFKSLSSLKEDTPYDYCDELFQNMKTKTNDITNMTMKSSCKVKGDVSDDMFTQCHHHLHAINTCVEYQQTMKDEMKRLGKLEHAIFQKTSSHAKRLQQIASNLNPEEDVGWIAHELDGLADLVSHVAQTHHQNAVTLSSHCGALQHALDSHHELMRSLHSRFPKPTSASSSPIPTSAGRNSIKVGGMTCFPHRSSSPRKPTTLAGININEIHENGTSQVLETAPTFQSQDKVIINVHGENGIDNACQNETAEGKRMSFTHAYFLFEEIRKPRLVLTNRIEYFRTQQSSVSRQLKDEESTITILKESTQDKCRPWYAQVRLEESLSLKEFLGEHSHQLDHQMAEAQHALDDFHLQNKEKLADILQVFAMHRICHNQNLKKTLLLIKSVFLRDRNLTHISEAAAQDLTENEDIEGKSTLVAIEDSPLRLTTDLSNSIVQAKCAGPTVNRKNVTVRERANNAVCTENEDSDRLSENEKVMKIIGGVNFAKIVELVKHLENTECNGLSRTLEPIKNVNLANSIDPDLTNGLVDDMDPPKIQVPDDKITPIREMVPNNMLSEETVREKAVENKISHAASSKFDKATFSRGPEHTESSFHQESISIQVDPNPTIDDCPESSPDRKYFPKQTKGFGDTAYMSPTISKDKTARLQLEGNHIRKTKMDSSPDSTDSDTKSDGYLDKSSPVDGPSYNMHQSPKKLFQGDNVLTINARNGLRSSEVVKEKHRLKKLGVDSDSISSSVDWTNNHELAMLSKYIPSEQLYPQGNAAKRKSGEDLAMSRKTQSGHSVTKLTRSQLALLNRLEQDLEQDEGQLKARRFINKYATKHHRSRSISRERDIPQVPFRLSEILRSQNIYANDDQGTGESEQRQGSCVELNLNNIHIERAPIFTKTLNKSSPPIPIRRDKRSNEGKIARNRQNNNVSIKKVTSTPFTRNIISSSPENNVSNLSYETNSVQFDVAETKLDSDAPDQPQDKFGQPANVLVKQLTKNISERTSIPDLSKSLTTDSKIPFRKRMIVSNVSSSDCRSEVRSNLSTCKLETFVPSDDSDWETDSVTSLTSTSLSTSIRPKRNVQKVLAPKFQRSMNSGRNSLEDNSTHINSISSVKSNSEAGQNHRPKLSKRVTFDENVQYRIPDD